MIPLARNRALARRWVAWRPEHGRSKVPIDPKTDRRAKSNDAATWGSRSQAKAIGRSSGLGVMLGDLGNGEALAGVDLDTCRDVDTGVFTDWAQRVIDRLDSYTEISPSGSGAKVFFTIDAGGDAKSEQNSAQGAKGSHPPAIDLFIDGRFFTVTGDDIGARSLRHVRDEDLRWVITQGRKLSGRDNDAPDNRARDYHPLTDEQVFDVLKHLPECYNIYERWIEAGQCLKSERGEDGFRFWLHLSSETHADLFEGEAQLREKWRGFKGEGRTIATLIKAALDNGLSPEIFHSRIDVGEAFEDLDDERPKRTTLRFFPAGDFDPAPPPFDFVPDVFFDRQLSIIYGDAGTGKTFWALHLACSVALGLEWFDRQCEPRNALYIALEGEGGLVARLRAWTMHNTPNANGSPISYAKGSLDLIGDDDARRAIVKFARETDVQFIIIDTLSRALSGRDENSSVDMSGLIAAADSIRRNAGAAVALIHHVGKNEAAGLRGHSSLKGAADTLIKIECSGEMRIARITKQKDGRDDISFPFRLEEVETDIQNARGASITSMTVVETGLFQDIDNLEPRERSGLDVLVVLVGINEIIGGGVTFDDWRAELRKRNWGPENHDSFRVAWSRLRKSLTEKGRISASGRNVELEIR